ncbi:MAG TPA: TIGR02266 family protein, partial [Myxococcaceae bacterium]|nr:TIGR02266 family protein [Myxococcaceae bacterium]
MFAPTPLRVRLPFRSEDEFVDQYGAHMGRDGFFLATRTPKPVGAQLLFDLVLADGSSLLRGEGVVVKSNVSGERPGMTLRFVRLEAAGKALVERIVSGRGAPGGARTESHAHPSAWAPPTGPTGAPPGSTRMEPVSRSAGLADWAPPAASVRPDRGGAVSPPPPDVPGLGEEPLPPEAEADVVPGDGSARDHTSEVSAAWAQEQAGGESPAPVEAEASSPDAPSSSAPDAGTAEPAAILEAGPELETAPPLESLPALETAPAVDGMLGGIAPEDARAQPDPEIPAPADTTGDGSVPETERSGAPVAAEDSALEARPAAAELPVVPPEPEATAVPGSSDAAVDSAPVGAEPAGATAAA